MNGPGEAGDADFGIAGGRDDGFIYAHGRVLKKVPSDILVDELFDEIDTLDRGRHAPAEAAEDGEAGRARDGRGLADPARLACPATMIARASQLFLPTLREDPADAEAVSHKLLVRGGFIRQVGAGLWTFLPLGWRVHQKVEQIIREEMDAIGGQEMLDAGAHAGRALGGDRPLRRSPSSSSSRTATGRDFVLPMTHEETVTFHAREIHSYRELPQILYHFQTKERDEPRPRGGLLRVREFIMKDAYSFDRDEEGLDASFQLHASAPTTGSSSAAGSRSYAVEAESGMMGGSESSTTWRRRARARTRSSRCENGDYAADLEIARGVPRAPEFPERARRARGGRDARA